MGKELVYKAGFKYSNDIREFAKQVVWYPCRERDLADFDEFLVFLLARGGERAIEHAREHFGITDADFQRAIYKKLNLAFSLAEMRGIPLTNKSESIRLCLILLSI